MTQKKGILIAGTFTGLILLTMLAFGFSNVSALFGRDSALAVQPVPAMQPVQTLDGSSQADMQALQDYVLRLESTLQTMQIREAQYQQRLQAANQVIVEMQQAQSNAGLAANGRHFEDDDD